MKASQNITHMFTPAPVSTPVLSRSASSSGWFQKAVMLARVVVAVLAFLLNLCLLTMLLGSVLNGAWLVTPDRVDARAVPRILLAVVCVGLVGALITTISAGIGVVVSFKRHNSKGVLIANLVLSALAILFLVLEFIGAVAFYKTNFQRWAHVYNAIYEQPYVHLVDTHSKFTKYYNPELEVLMARHKSVVAHGYVNFKAALGAVFVMISIKEVLVEALFILSCIAFIMAVNKLRKSSKRNVGQSLAGNHNFHVPLSGPLDLAVQQLSMPEEEQQHG